ncbi:MAG: hypothetical protein ACRC5R_01425 [Mycoplasmatales bacterium]
MKNRWDVRLAFIAESSRREDTIHLLIREINAEIDKLNYGEISGSIIADDFHNAKGEIKEKMEKLKKINRLDI